MKLPEEWGKIPEIRDPQETIMILSARVVELETIISEGMKTLTTSYPGPCGFCECEILESLDSGTTLICKKCSGYTVVELHG